MGLCAFFALLDGSFSFSLVVVLNLSWQGRLTGMLAAWICVAIVTAYYLIREGWLAKSVDTAYAKDALSYGVPLIPHAVGGLMLGIADRFMVNNILDVSSTGIYVVAVQLGMILGMLFDSFNKAFAPWLMEELASISPTLQKRIVRFTYAYFLAIFFLAMLGGIIGPLILPLLVGREFQSRRYFDLYFDRKCVHGDVLHDHKLYIFQQKNWVTLDTYNHRWHSNSYNKWFLIKAYGLTGAAIGFMLGQIGLFLGAWVISYMCVPMPWFRALTLTSRVNLQ